MIATTLFFVANVLFCLAYVVRDIFYLRVITLVAVGAAIPYYAFRDEPLWSAIGWQAAFGVINGINLLWLWRQRRPVQLSERQLRVYQMAFPGLSPRQFLQLLDAGEWRHAEAGRTLIDRGTEPRLLLLIVAGRAQVEREDQALASLTEGMFVGEMSLMTGQATSADVVTASEVEYLEWTADALERLKTVAPFFENFLPLVLGQDVANKLRSRLDLATGPEPILAGLQ